MSKKQYELTINLSENYLDDPKGWIMPTGEDFTNCPKALSYPLTRGGCAGFSLMLAQALLCMPYDNNSLTYFKQRIALIGFFSKKNDNFYSLKKEIAQIKSKKERNEYEKKILDILPFYDGVALFARAITYEKVFSKCLFQEDYNDIFSFTKPGILDSPTNNSTNELQRLFKNIGVFTKKDLINYLRSLEQIFEESIYQENGSKKSFLTYPILLSCLDHIIVIWYDHQKKWHYADLAALNESFDTQIMGQLCNSVFSSLAGNTNPSLPYNEQGIVMTTEILAFGQLSAKLEEQRKIFNELSLKYPVKEKDISVYNAKGQGLLQLACQHGELEMVNHLLKMKGIDPNKKDYKGYSPLMLAAMRGYVDIVKSLFAANKTDANIVCTSKLNCLHLACAAPFTRNKNELFEVLLKQGVNISARAKKTITAFDLAVETENITAIRVLAKYAMDNKLKIYQIVSREFYKNALRILLENEEDSKLFVFFTSDLESIISFFIAPFRALLVTKNINGLREEFLENLMDIERAPKMLGKIFSDGKDLQQNKALDVAQENNKKIISTLIQTVKTSDLSKLKIKAKKNYGDLSKFKTMSEIIYETLVKICCKAGDLKHLKFLPKKSYHALVSRMEARHELTPLLIACLYGQEDIVRYLLETKKDNVNYQEKNGLSALFVAALAYKTNKHNLLQCLIDAGANLLLKNADGETPLTYVINKNFSDQETIIALLQACEAQKLNPAEIMTEEASNILRTQKDSPFLELSLLNYIEPETNKSNIPLSRKKPNVHAFFANRLKEFVHIRGAEPSPRL